MLKKDDRADELVRLYLSFFTLNRVVLLAKKISSNTFKSMIQPGTPMSAVWCGELRDELPKLTRRYIPFVSSVPLHQGLRWVPTWKSLPTGARVNGLFSEVLSKLKLGRIVSCFPALLFEMNAFSFLLERVHVSEDHFSQGVLWHSYTRFALDKGSKSITNWCLDQFERVTGPQLPTYHQLKEPPIAGRLGQSIVGGGKRRIFAIGNYVNQRLLWPVHEWGMNVLRRIPTDGTFHQERPLDRLVGSVACFSYDLSAATDRWPLQIIFEMMQHLFDRSFSSSVRSALALNVFEVPFVGRANSSVCFVCGQPLGYYSSWPLFTLSHHYLVWWCAEQAYPGRKFLEYGILGDDVVIADSNVATIYAQTLARIGVKISYQKSLVSDSGGAEFAKRLRIRNMSKDISPVSVRALLSFFNPFGLIAIGLKYNCKRLSTLVRIGGGGYRRLGRLDHSPSKRSRRILAMHRKALLTNDHLDLWFGQGMPLNPYLKYHLINKILSKMAPKALKKPPLGLFVTEKVYDFTEYSVQRGWMEQWISYLRWYHMVALSPDVRFSDLFNGPVCTTNWRADQKDENLVRFGVLWTMFDLAVELGQSFSIPILGDSRTEQRCFGYLLGGVSGNDFLVSSFGLVQPRARAGVIVAGVVRSGYERRNPCLTLIQYKKSFGIQPFSSVYKPEVVIDADDNLSSYLHFFRRPCRGGNNNLDKL